MDDRLTKLEILYSDQSRTIEEMSSEMFQQQKEIAALKRQLVELQAKLENPENEIGGHERPPHY
jgi:uncharacterized coiled-coil protein SlyX